MISLQHLRRRATRAAAVALAASAVSAASLLGAAPAQAEFGFVDTSLTATLTGPGGAEVDRAGAHPDLTVGFDLRTKLDVRGREVPDGSLKDLTVTLPAGLVGNPVATPRCTFREFNVTRCNAASLVGLNTITYASQASGRRDTETVPVYNLAAPRGVAARFGFKVTAVTVIIDARVRSDGGYTLAADVRGLQTGLQIFGNDLTLWGVPADQNGPGPLDLGTDGAGNPITYGAPGPGPRLPFINAPTRCGVPLFASFAARSWQQPDVEDTAETRVNGGLTSCESLPFAPSVDVQPHSTVAGQPAGYTVDVSVPQTPDPEGVSTAHLRDATVALPEGVAISPPAAAGLGACSDAQLAVNSVDEETCPESSTIGTVQVDTPLLDEPLTGRLYLGTQESSDPSSGRMYRLFVAAYGSGVRLKLQGGIRADPTTGRLTTTFDDNPQLPFSRLRLQFQGGDRAPLVNPTTCGPKTTTGTLTSWAGQSRDVSSSFAIDQGCPTGAFAPSFTAGTLDPLAGRVSPFTMTATRTDAEQELSKIALELPSGLLGALGTVPVCADAAAAAGTCDPSTRLGTQTVSVGSGGRPFALNGTVSLAGPYKGAPFSLSIAVPAKAGPLDLGMVVVRSPLVIDANRARVSAPVDDLPQIVGGVPLRYRSISLTLDRPGFMWNATSCKPQTVVGAFTSTGGAMHRPGVRYQAQGCDKLQVDPKLALRWAGRGELKKGRHPAIEADLTDTFGHANLKSVAVTLPLTASLDPDNAKALCEAAGAAARTCPEASIVGRASATTTALHEPLTGPIYFVKGTRRTASGKIAKTTPKLYLKLRGDGVDVDLHVDSSVKDKHLVATFRDIPDVPLQDFKLRLSGGKGGPIVATNDPCAAEKSTAVVFRGQNGAVTRRTLRFTAPECKPAVSTAVGTASRVTVRVGGIGPGRLSISGPRVRGASTRISAADAAQVTAGTRLTAAQKRLLSRGRSIKVAVRVTFKPKAGKSITFKRTVTIKGVKRGSGT
jgi:hypothetical protein